jgi:hypothetical protein
VHDGEGALAGAADGHRRGGGRLITARPAQGSADAADNHCEVREGAGAADGHRRGAGQLTG